MQNEGEKVKEEGREITARRMELAEITSSKCSEMAGRENKKKVRDIYLEREREGDREREWEIDIEREINR